MPTTIHCIRHAQGYHNLGLAEQNFPDPTLTDLGHQQCATLQQEHFPPSTQSRIHLLCSSPLTRTLQTTTLVFPEWLSSSTAPYQGATVPRTILALPSAQETSDYPCDTGTPLSQLHKLCAKNNWNVDLSLLSPSALPAAAKGDWTDKTLTSPYSPHHDAILARAKETRLILRQKAKELRDAGVQNPEIALVTHGGFLHYFSGDWEGAGEGFGTGWKNCETRRYQFEDNENAKTEVGRGGNGDCKVIETDESRTARGQTAPRLSWAEQEKLVGETMRMWEEGGLQRPDRIGEEGWISGRVVAAANENDAAVADGEEGDDVIGTTPFEQKRGRRASSLRRGSFSVIGDGEEAMGPGLRQVESKRSLEEGERERRASLTQQNA